MVRTVLANRKLERYVTKLSEENKFLYGVIVGQTSSLNKDYVIHLAKTPSSTDADQDPLEEEKNLNNKSNSISSIEKEKEKVVESVDNFDSQNLVNHSVNVTKMIPGSFYILGVFAITEKSIFENNATVNKFRNILREVNLALELNKYFCGQPPYQEKGEKILLNYIWPSRSFQCKSFDNTGSNPTPVDWKFLDKPTVWHMFESNYELDDLFPIQDRSKYLNLEQNFLTALEHISDYIAHSDIFIQNEYVDENQSLESYIKEKYTKKETINSFRASVLQSMSTSTKSKCPPTITEFWGTIRYVGIISSRVWVHPKSSFKDIQTFIRNDILRSLAARIQIFCDGLTNPNASNDVVIVNIPPKRVFFDIPDSGGIQFSEYLFNGENVNTVIDQAQEILDLHIDEDNVVMELEILPDYKDTMSIYAQQPSNSSNSEKNKSSDDNKKLLYFGGIVIAAAILILSILLHYIFR